MPRGKPGGDFGYCCFEIERAVEDADASSTHAVIYRKILWSWSQVRGRGTRQARIMRPRPKDRRINRKNDIDASAVDDFRNLSQHLWDWCQIIVRANRLFSGRGRVEEVTGTMFHRATEF